MVDILTSEEYMAVLLLELKHVNKQTKNQEIPTLK